MTYSRFIHSMEAERKRLDSAIRILKSGDMPDHHVSNGFPPKKRVMSQSARDAISKAQKRRWKKLKSA